MTLEQALKRIQDKESQIDSLEQEIRETKEKLIELTPLKKGDKVKLTGYKNKETICFVSGVEYKLWREEQFEYTFVAMKKDGTPSLQSPGIYYYDKIEKID